MEINLIVYALQLGGAEVHTIELAHRLRARGHRIRVLEHGTGDCYDRERDRFGGAAFEVHHYLWDLSVPFSDYLRFLRSHPADLALLIKWLFTVGGIRTDLATWLSYPRFWTVEHSMADPMPEGRRAALRRRILSAIRCRFPQRVICMSQAIRQRLIRQEGYPASKQLSARYALDARRFQPSEVFRRQAREQWSISQTNMIFGVVARMSREKGVSRAVYGFSRVRASEAGRDAWLVLAGDGVEREMLEQMARDLKIEDRTRFIGFQNNPWEIFPAFDCVLVPSVSESFGLSLLEAMACSVPGIAMNVGGISEVFSDPRMGWLIPAGDRDAFAAAMIQAAAMPREELRGMGRAAHRHAVDNFDLEPSYDKVIRMLEDPAQRG